MHIRIYAACAGEPIVHAWFSATDILPHIAFLPQFYKSDFRVPFLPFDFVVDIPRPNWLICVNCCFLEIGTPQCYHLLLAQNQGKDLNKGLKLSITSEFK